LTAAEIDDPTLYDVTLNTGRLGFARAAEGIAQLAWPESFPHATLP
jgi:hypothetical protein